MICFICLKSNHILFSSTATTLYLHQDSLFSQCKMWNPYNGPLGPEWSGPITFLAPSSALSFRSLTLLQTIAFLCVPPAWVHIPSLGLCTDCLLSMGHFPVRYPHREHLHFIQIFVQMLTSPGALPWLRYWGQKHAGVNAPPHSLTACSALSLYILVFYRIYLFIMFILLLVGLH